MLTLVDLFLVKWLTVLEIYVVRSMGPTLSFSLNDTIIFEMKSNAVNKTTFIEEIHILLN